MHEFKFTFFWLQYQPFSFPVHLFLQQKSTTVMLIYVKSRSKRERNITNYIN